MAIIIKIKSEVQTVGNKCTVRKANGQVLGIFSPNQMAIYADDPYDPIPHKTTFKPEGAGLVDWITFKKRMFTLNGRIVYDTAMPEFLKTESAFSRVE